MEIKEVESRMMFKCEVCNKNELNNYCSTNVCKECCEDGKCPVKYKCSAYAKILEDMQEQRKIIIKFDVDDLPDYCEDCKRELGDVIYDEIYDKEIEKERKYQKKYKKGLWKDFEEKLFNTFDKEGRHQLNLYIQKESSEYTVATLISLREKLRIKNIQEIKKRE